MQNNKQTCLENSKLWQVLYKMQRANNNIPIVLTPQQRSTLCNYVYGRPFNKVILQSIFKK
jgi:hypothetical protein